MMDPPEGILLIDKEAWMTSAAVVSRVRRLFGIRRVGHTGTLDPFATGLLPVCLGRATAAAAYMLNWSKRYRCEVRLGYATSTMDSEGEVTERAAHPSLWQPFLDQGDSLAADALKKAVASLTAVTWQQAPLYSAVKVQGKPLYRYAREGREVERPVRQVKVFAADFLGLRADDSGYPLVEIEFLVSSGTYIRSLASQLGEELSCPSHAASLMRLAAGHFELSSAWRLEQLTDDPLSRLLPVGSAFCGWPGLPLTREQALDLAYGRSIACDESVAVEPDREAGRLSPPPGDNWRACWQEGRLIATATIEERRCRARRVFVRPEEL